MAHSSVAQKHHLKRLCQRIKKEILSWRRLTHPNIMPMEGVVYRDGSRFPCLVSRWIPSGTASKYCATAPEDFNILKFVSQCLCLRRSCSLYGSCRFPAYRMDYLICTEETQRMGIFEGYFPNNSSSDVY